MSNVMFCDNDDCENNSNDTEIFTVPDDVGRKLVKKRWFMTYFDINICEECLDEYYNDGEECLKADEYGIIRIGKDFKE